MKPEPPEPLDEPVTLNPPDTGQATAEMLLTLPAFIVGEVLFGAPAKFQIDEKFRIDETKVN